VSDVSYVCVAQERALEERRQHQWESREARRVERARARRPKKGAHEPWYEPAVSPHVRPQARADDEVRQEEDTAESPTVLPRLRSLVRGGSAGWRPSSTRPSPPGMLPFDMPSASMPSPFGEPPSASPTVTIARKAVSERRRAKKMAEVQQWRAEQRALAESLWASRTFRSRAPAPP
jgi:hypothetical protein